MAPDVNPLHPSVILPIDGLVRQLDEVVLCDGVVLRNLDASELDRINGMIDSASWFGIKPFDPEILCIESSIPGEQCKTDSFDAHRHQITRIGTRVAEEALSLIRLALAGPVAARLVVWPLADTIPSAYTLAQIGYLPGIRRRSYPLEYRCDPTVVSTLQQLFSRHWKKDVQGVPGVRWLNKAQAELNEDDRFVHLVVGLEQLLLRGEGERSYLSYKMALRAAWLLGTNAGERSTVFCHIRVGYGIRSKIAHGSLSRTLTEEEDALATTLEEYLRRLATMYLDDPALFAPSRLDQVVLGELETARSTHGPD